MANDQDARRDRDQQILNRLARIENKVDSIDQTTAFSLRAESDKHRGSLIQIFGTSKRRAQVYLAADGQRSVGDIATHLGMQRQDVGTELKALSRERLLELAGGDGGRDVWAKKALDTSFRISPFLERHFSLRSDGIPNPTTTGRKAKGTRGAKR
jgi:hypothetical protein